MVYTDSTAEEKENYIYTVHNLQWSIRISSAHLNSRSGFV